MDSKDTNQTPNQRQGKDSKMTRSAKLFRLLKTSPISRRMAATALGYTDMTYMVTDDIKAWLMLGKAEVVCHVKCTRSGRRVQGVTTNEDLFISKNGSNQLSLFGDEG